MAEDKSALTSAEVDELLPQLEGWTRDQIILSRNFTLANFKDITSFLNHLVKTITEMNHHPDFALNTGTKTVSVSVTTHSEQAITHSDVQFARALNAWHPGS